MKFLRLLLLSSALSGICHAQEAQPQKLIELAKAYHSFMLRNEPPAQTLKELRADMPEQLKGAAAFIVEAITTNNRLLHKSFLSLPDEQTLRAVYVVNVLFENMYADEPKEYTRVTDSAMGLQPLHQVMVSNYYRTLFDGLGNKNKLLDFSRVDFRLKELGLSNESDAAIFFLQCMRHCNSTVWGYLNIAKPMNTKLAMSMIGQFPKFNGQPYYQYNDFNFPDFLMVTDNKNGPESYKRYYLDKFYELLLYHLICIKKEGKTEKERQDLLLGSILRERKYYKYTSYKSDLEQLFEEGPLQFNQHFMDCENCWIATAADSMGTYNYSFAYIDEAAGPTLQHGGTFHISDDGSFTQVFHDTISIKYRLEPMDSRIAPLTESAIKAMKLPDMPAWLPVYLKDTGTIKSLAKRGYLYNAWNRPDKALLHLERAQKIDPHYAGVAMELAFAHNALGQYEKALNTLQAAPEAKQDPCYYYKEYNFSQLKLGRLDAAAGTFAEAVKACGNKAMKAEMAYNIAFEYYGKKDVAGVRRWAGEVRNWAEPGDQFMNAIAVLEKKLQD